MAEDPIIGTSLILAVEVPRSSTPRVVDIIHRGARDEVDPGAHLIIEKAGTNIGVGMQRKSTTDVGHRIMIVVVIK